MVSTTARTVETCQEVDPEIATMELYAHLNPLKKGIFEDLTLKEIEERDPAWYQQFEEDRLHTRFPAGVWPRVRVPPSLSPTDNRGGGGYQGVHARGTP